MKIYVGNLPHSTTEAELRRVFEKHGAVTSADLITDRNSGESRGFGFVDMPTIAEARAAISSMNGKDMGGRPLTVNEARPREVRT